MTLLEYLQKNNLKPTPWATKNEIAPSVVSRYLNGKGVSKENALKISKATNGEVTIVELLYPDKVKKRVA